MHGALRKHEHERAPGASRETDRGQCFLFASWSLKDIWFTWCHAIRFLLKNKQLLPLNASLDGGLVTKLCPTFAIPRTVALQVSLSMGFSSQEYCSGLPFPSPGHLPDLGMDPGSPALQEDCLLSEPPGKPLSTAATL